MRAASKLADIAGTSLVPVDEEHWRALASLELPDHETAVEVPAALLAEIAREVG